MTKEEMIKWIDNATYLELLSKWRNAPVGDSFFAGDVGDYYQKAMENKRKEVGDEEHVRASKSIGFIGGIVNKGGVNDVPVSPKKDIKPSAQSRVRIKKEVFYRNNE